MLSLLSTHQKQHAKLQRLHNLSTKHHAPNWRVTPPLNEALPPPLFRPKSKLPRLQDAGIQPPELHCFTSSGATTIIPKSPHAAIFLKPTATSLPSPATFRKAATSLQSTVNKDESDAEKARSLLREIFFEIRFSSKLFCEIQNSASIEQHINRIADSLGTGGLLMYVQVWNHWARTPSSRSYRPPTTLRGRKIHNLRERE